MELKDLIFYKAGSAGVTEVVGVESRKNRIARYTLQTPAAGASAVTLRFANNWVGAGTTPSRLGFYIGTDPDSHSNAGAGSVCTGILERTGGYNYEGSAEILLLPDTLYYVWVFPTTTTFGWVFWSLHTEDATAELSGGAVSTLTASGGALGEPMDITVNRCRDYTHTISYALGSAGGILLERSSETALSWTPSPELARQLPDSVEGELLLTVTSFDGDEQVGEPLTVAVPVTVPETMVPTAEASWVDTSGAWEKLGTLVRRVSQLQVEVTGTGSYGSTVTEAALTLDGKPYTGGVLESGGELTVTVTDSRGRTGSRVYSLTAADYDPPTVRLSASRCLSDGTLNDMGEFALVTVRGSVSDINGRNGASLALWVGTRFLGAEVAAGEVLWQQVVEAPSVTAVTLSATLTDQLLTSPEASMVLSIGYATVDLLLGGRGIAFGTTAKKPGFTCAMDTDFAGHPVRGLPEPAWGDEAARKDYVDQLRAYVEERLAAPDPTPVTLEANTALPLSLEPGQVATVSYKTTKTGNGDIFLRVNGDGPDSAGYTFPGSSTNFTAGQVGYSGSSLAATTQLCLRFHGSDLVVTGEDLRGNGTGVGRSFLVWRELTQVQSVAFTAPGTVVTAITYATPE